MADVPGVLAVGASATLERVVGAEDTAAALGSGDLEVLGTPRLLAWCEQATLDALGALSHGRTSVGTRVELTHERASVLGTGIRVTATVVHVDGRLVRLDVAAEQDTADSGSQVVARGQVTRVLVDRERFLSRL